MRSVSARAVIVGTLAQAMIGLLLIGCDRAPEVVKCHCPKCEAKCCEVVK